MRRGDDELSQQTHFGTTDAFQQQAGEASGQQVRPQAYTLRAQQQRSTPRISTQPQAYSLVNQPILYHPAQAAFPFGTFPGIVATRPSQIQGLGYVQTPAAYHTPVQPQASHLGWGGQPTGFTPPAVVRTWPGQGQRRPAQQEIIASLASAVASLPAASPATDLVAGGLARLDSRAAASFFKELSTRGLTHRAWEIFNWLSSIPPDSPQALLRGLLDVYVYTAMISLCAASKDVDSALELSRDMERKGIALNVHTYSALMNVAVKAGRSQLALDTFQRMHQAGCMPNLVTYNTLIDVYGKLGLWADAIQVLSVMRERGVDPVVRTYNTLMIACTISNRWQEALQVYQRMREAGLKPNTTTYNALISAYSKAGQLDNVMATFNEMVKAGCERSVITYSTLIAACERAHQWETALQLFARMPADNCQPNTITYNSLITACSEGMQWQKALQLFDDMLARGLTPDVVSYTALISACGKGCQWRRALQAFAQMQTQGCRADHIIYLTIIETLWSTGIKLPQLRAIQLYRQGMQQGVMQHIEPIRGLGQEVAETSITSSTPVMLMLALIMLMADHRDKVLSQGPALLPPTLVVRMGGRGRARDPLQGSSLVVGVRGWLRAHRCPLQLTSDTYGGSMRLVAPRSQLAVWLQSEAAGAALAGMSPAPGTSAAAQEATLQQEEARYVTVEAWCAQARHLVQQFESSHRLSVAALSVSYLEARPALLARIMQVGLELQLSTEQLYDALLLLDRAMCGGGEVLREQQVHTALLAALCIILHQQSVPAPPPTLAGREPPGGPRGHGIEEQLAQSTGVAAQQLRAMQAVLRVRLAQGTAAVSAAHSLRMYHCCLGRSSGAIPSVTEVLAVALSPVSTPVSTTSSDTLQSRVAALTLATNLEQSMHSTQLLAATNRGLGVDPATAAAIQVAPSQAITAAGGVPHPRQLTFGAFVEQAEAGGSTLALPDLSQLSLRGSVISGTAPQQASTALAASGAALRAQDLQRAASMASSQGAAATASAAAAAAAAAVGSVGSSAVSSNTSTGAAQVSVRTSAAGEGSAGAAGSGAGSASRSRVDTAGASDEAAPLADAEVKSYQLLHLALSYKESLNLRPSVVAAAALYASRLLYGQLPLWPTALVQLMGCLDVTDPEMAAAISLMHKLQA